MARSKYTLVFEDGLDRVEPQDDAVMGFVMQGVATNATSTTAALPLTTASVTSFVKLRSIDDAKGYGLNEAYDTTNKVLVYHHVERFFHRCPQGTLYLMLVANTGTVITLTNMADKTKNFAKTLSRNLNGALKSIALILNPVVAYTASATTGGWDADVLTAIPKAQELIDEEAAAGRYLEIIIEGRQFTGTVTNATNLRTLNSGDVHVFSGQEPSIAATVFNTSDTPYKYYAAVGDYAGCIMSTKVSRSVAWARKLRVDQVANNNYLITPYLSSNLPITAYSEADLDSLHDKGCIFFDYRTGNPGTYICGTPTCTSLSKDKAWVENARTLNKAARLLMKEYALDGNRDIYLNTDGTIRADIVRTIEVQGEKALKPMKDNDEVSNLKVTVDPAQNFFDNLEKVFIEYRIQPVGVAKELKGTLKLVTSL